MRIRLLPSSAGRESQLQSLTCFLVNENIAVDGGSLGFALTPDEMGAIRHIIVTHAHSDHTASLPVYIAEAFTLLTEPVIIYALPEVVAALREHIFNDNIWPNFEKIPLGNGKGPTLEFRTIEPRKRVEIAGVNVTAIPVNHVVPTAGLMLQEDGAAVVFTSDTYSTDEIWSAARNLDHLKAVFVDVSFPNELSQLAAASKHLTPELLAQELEKLDREVEILAVHIKPTNRDEVIRQLRLLNNDRVSVGEVNRIYEW